MNTDKFEQVVGYFDANSIKLPTDVRNAIEDVFQENDDIELVQCYHKNELGDFQNDLRFHNEVNLFMNGTNTGTIYNAYTYYGGIDLFLSEHVQLMYNKETVEEEITRWNLDSNNSSRIYNENEYVVLLIEKVSWDADGKTDVGSLTRENTLYIYCPVELPDEE